MVKILVKTALKSEKYKNWPFSFMTKTTKNGKVVPLKTRVDKADFVILWAFDFGFFIIPADLVKSHTQIVPRGKWESYQDAWHLLKGESLI